MCSMQLPAILSPVPPQSLHCVWICWTIPSAIWLILILVPLPWQVLQLTTEPCKQQNVLVMIVAYLHNPLQIDPNINCSMLRNHAFVWFNMHLHVLLLFGCLVYGNISTFGHSIYETCCHYQLWAASPLWGKKKTTTIITTKTTETKFFIRKPF